MFGKSLFPHAFSSWFVSGSMQKFSNLCWYYFKGGTLHISFGCKTVDISVEVDRAPLPFGLLIKITKQLN